MGGKRGGILGTILNVVSIFVPPLRPVAMVLNTINAVKSGDPLALASSAMGWANYGGGSFGGIGDKFSSDMGSLGDMFSPAETFADSSGWSSNAFDGSSVGGFDSSGWSSNAFDGSSNLGNSFDVASQGMENLGASNYLDTTKGFQDLQGQIAGGVDGAQAAVGDAVNFSKQAGIAAGSEGVAQSTLKDLYTVPQFNYDISGLNPSLKINTLGGYEGAFDTLSEGGGMSLTNVQTMQNAGDSMQNMFKGGGVSPMLSTDSTMAFNGANPLDNSYGADNVANLDQYQVDAGNPSITKGLDTSGGEWNQPQGTQNAFAQQQSPVGEGGYDWSNLGQTKTGPMTSLAGNSTQVSIPDGGGLNMQQSDNGNLWKRLTGALGSANKMGPMGKMEALGTLGSGLYSEYQHGKATDNLMSMYNRSMGAADPFASDRALASSKWQESINDPESAWKEYAAGAGGRAMQEAAAKYARAGRRNMLPQLMAQQKMQFMADYLPKYRESVNPKQFGSNQAAVGAAYAQPMATMTANRGGNLAAAFGKVGDRGGFDSLASLWS